MQLVTSSAARRAFHLEREPAMVRDRFGPGLVHRATLGTMLVADRRARVEWLAQRMTEHSTAEVAALRAATPVLEKLMAP